jgi:hypothetical protein
MQSSGPNLSEALSFEPLVQGHAVEWVRPFLEVFLGIIQRAYELTEDCLSVDEIRHRLKREGFEAVDAHLASRLLRADLITRMKARA